MLGKLEHLDIGNADILQEMHWTHNEEYLRENNFENNILTST